MSEPETTSRAINLGVVTLDAIPGWNFFPMEDRVVGRPASGVGGVQIVRVSQERVPWPASHELCMAAAVETSGYEISPPGTDRAKHASESCTAGGESFSSGGDWVRIWYRHCPSGMIASWFAVKAVRIHDRSVIEAIRQCDNMMATIRLPLPCV